jgi:hypothetical protein
LLLASSVVLTLRAFRHLGRAVSGETLHEVPSTAPGAGSVPVNLEGIA